MTDKKYEEIQEGDIFEFKEAGDSIEGKYKMVQHEVGPNKSELYILEKENGEHVKVWGSYVLDNKMALLDLGTEIKIEFKGRVKPEKGNEYKDFAVYLVKN